MFKIIGRILIILLVAAIVAGALYALVQNGSSAGTANQFSGRAFDRNPGGDFAPQNGFREGGREGQFSLGRGIGGIIGTVLKISVIVLLVLLVQNGLASLKSRRATGSA